MTPALVLSFLMFAFASSITPGPNNVMLMASGANFGFRATVPHLLGVILGFGFMVLVVGLGLAEVFEAMPAVYEVLRAVGTVYLFYLAYKVATASGLGTNASSARPMTFTQTMAFQWVNPKAWTMAVVAVTAYAPADHRTLNIAVVSALFVLVGLPCSSTWAGFGVALKRRLSRPAPLRVFNIVMALLLVASLWPVLFDYFERLRSHPSPYS